jgi:hypothetical protein
MPMPITTIENIINNKEPDRLKVQLFFKTPNMKITKEKIKEMANMITSI